MQIFQKVKLGDLVELITKGTTPSTIGKKFTHNGINYIKSESITQDGFIDKNSFAFVDEETHQLLRRSIINEKDILFSIAGIYLGKTAIVKKNHLPANTNQAVAIIRLKHSLVNYKFIYYIFQTKEFIKKIYGFKGQAAQPNISLSDLKSIKVDIPNRETQSRIASVLSAYDDLIENNEKRIKTLEDMAQRLYTEWFVKFKFPGHEKTPMVDSGTEYGMIPEGWEVKRIEDLYKTSSGGTPSRNNETEFYSEGSISWVKTKELNDSYILDTEEKITELAVKKSSAKMFPQNTVLIAMYGATIGKLGILSEPATTNQACCAFLLREKSYSSYYIFQFLKNNINKITNLAFGAAQPNISQNTVQNIEILKPVSDILDLYNEKIKLLFNEILIIQKQNKYLSSMRDLLIPQLVTGKKILK